MQSGCTFTFTYYLVGRINERIMNTIIMGIFNGFVRNAVINNNRANRLVWYIRNDAQDSGKNILSNLGSAEFIFSKVVHCYIKGIPNKGISISGSEKDNALFYTNISIIYNGYSIFSTAYTNVVIASKYVE